MMQDHMNQSVLFSFGGLVSTFLSFFLSFFLSVVYLHCIALVRV